MQDGKTMKGERPEMQDDKTMKGERPQKSDHDNMNGEPPEISDGEMMNGEVPEMPDGEMMNGEPPEMLNGKNMNEEPMKNAQKWGQGGNVTTSEGDASTITINGGYIYVNAEGDGLDANNSIYVNGGTVLIDGPENSGNGALDYDRECIVSAGVLIAAGSSGMMQSISSNSEQAGLAFVMNSAQSADAVLCLKDQNGTTLYSYSPSKTFSSVVISAPELVSGETYALYSGGTVTGAAAHGFGAENVFSLRRIEYI